MKYLDISVPLDPVALQFRAIQFASPNPGPRLIVTGAVHGNETCGTRGIFQVLEKFSSGELALIQGQVTFVPITNPLAFNKRQRNGDRNLNRNLRPTQTIQEFEDRIANWLCPLLGRHDALLDLHSFHTGGQPFAMVGPTNNDGSLEPFAQAAAEEAMAGILGVSRFVDGWLSTYAKGVQRRMARYSNPADRKQILSTDPFYGVGTTEYMRSVGGMAITLECGSHDSAESPWVAYRAIMNCLSHFGLIDQPVVTAEPIRGRETLSLYDVIDKDDAMDAFAKNWSSFDRVEAGDLIGTRATGEQVVASDAGFIVFPNPRAEAGNEWFYLARHSHRMG